MSSTRFVALDALRGLILALMILVNTPGSWSAVYSPLLHADWHGFTFADLVFPGFLFVVGAAMFFALKTPSVGHGFGAKSTAPHLIDVCHWSWFKFFVGAGFEPNAANGGIAADCALLWSGGFIGAGVKTFANRR